MSPEVVLGVGHCEDVRTLRQICSLRNLPSFEENTMESNNLTEGKTSTVLEI
jgi:hypothetical protein